MRFINYYLNYIVKKIYYQTGPAMCVSGHQNTTSIY